MCVFRGGGDSEPPCSDVSVSMQNHIQCNAGSPLASALTVPQGPRDPHLLTVNTIKTC